MRWRATSVRPSAKGDLGEVDRLLQLGASPDAVATGEPAVCAAAVGGHARCVERLLAAGASPLATTNFKETALHLAARGGWGRACHLLLPRHQRICNHVLLS